MTFAGGSLAGRLPCFTNCRRSAGRRGPDPVAAQRIGLPVAGLADRLAVVLGYAPGAAVTDQSAGHDLCAVSFFIRPDKGAGDKTMRLGCDKRTIMAMVLTLWGTDDLSRLNDRVYKGVYPCQMPEKDASPADLPLILDLAFRYTGKKEGAHIEEGWNVHGVYALFAMAFALVSDKTKAVIDSLMTGDHSCLDAPFQIEEAPDIDDIRAQVINNHLMMLHSLHNRVKYWQFSRPLVKHFERPIDLVLSAEQRYKFPSIDSYNNMDYWDNRNGVFLRLNPHAPVDVLCEKVRKIMVEYQMQMAKEHDENWNESERDFFGTDYIDSMNPLKEFDYRRGTTGKSTDSLEKLFTTWGECLRAYQYLQLGMRKVDIARRLFPVTFDSNSASPGYKRATEDTRQALKYADKLISASLSGTPLPLAIRPK